jgi:hypothetical protein
MVADLDAGSRRQRRRAVQTLSDYCDEPVGLIGCWPFSRYGPGQLDALVDLYKEWWHARKESRATTFSRYAAVTRAPGVGAAAPPAEQAAAEGPVRPWCGPLRDLFWHLKAWAREAGRGRPEPAEPDPVTGPLPPLPVPCFVDAMLPWVEETLYRTAGAINDAPSGQVISGSEPRVFKLFEELQTRALEVGRNLRMEEAEEGSGGIPLVTRATLPERSLAVKRGPVAAVITRAADALKDAIIDLGAAEQRDTPMDIPDLLPPMSWMRFLELLRGKAEDTLRKAAEVINETPDGEPRGFSAERFEALFLELQWEALELGLQLRIEAATAGTASSPEAGREEVKQFHLRKAAGLHTPDALGCRLDWGKKYRLMRVAGTSLPFSESTLPPPEAG